MHFSLTRIIRLLATVALLATLALGITPIALGDDWASDRAVARSAAELDPAIRAAIAARATTPSSAVPIVAPSVSSVDDGFAWGAAGLGLAAGIAGMGVLLGCVTLVRHDGRLRNA